MILVLIFVDSDDFDTNLEASLANIDDFADVLKVMLASKVLNTMV